MAPQDAIQTIKDLAAKMGPQELDEVKKHVSILRASVRTPKLETQPTEPPLADAPSTESPPLETPLPKTLRLKNPQPKTQQDGPAPPPIPKQVQDLADYIKAMPRNPRGRRNSTFPSRNGLKADDRLKGEINRKTGCLRVVLRKGQLRRFAWDERLFSKEMWDYLLNEGIPDTEES